MKRILPVKKFPANKNQSNFRNAIGNNEKAGVKCAGLVFVTLG